MSQRLLQNLAVRYYGGLGNQIFQYAAHLYFAERFSTGLRVIQPYGTDLASKGFDRPFQLNEFSLSASISPPTAIDRFYFSNRPSYLSLQRRLRVISKMRSIDVIEEPSPFSFFPTLLDNVSSRTVYLRGHWQAAGYADANPFLIRKALRLKNEPRQQSLYYEEAIRKFQCPVSIHIRVGDYALHSTVDSKGGERVSWVLSNTYYRKAIACMKARYPQAEFVVFSDDPAAAKAIMGEESVGLWIEGNSPSTAFEEMWLMSCCKHHIIANSSFSWWGAWMNSNSIKSVIAPKFWFNTRDSYFPALFPSSWSVIDNLVDVS